MDIYQFCEEHGIRYERHDHPPVYTCEESDRLVPSLPAAKTKNLFLRDRQGGRHFLVAVGYEKSVDLKALSVVLGVSRLSLAGSDRLGRYLGVEPGAVTILALANDRQHEVGVVLDETLWNAAALRCHPLVNTSTWVVSKENIRRFLDITGHQVQVLDVPERR